ncbi:MAG: hypothetical protein AAB944_00500 [Patescibacteria group bacterium]
MTENIQNKAQAAVLRVKVAKKELCGAEKELEKIQKSCLHKNVRNIRGMSNMINIYMGKCRDCYAVVNRKV